MLQFFQQVLWIFPANQHNTTASYLCATTTEVRRRPDHKLKESLELYLNLCGSPRTILVRSYV